ncbi:hypothetical protein GF108_17300 [Phyllobacterium sp. SYP-B3895]|uniref:hypothetical protein n=1 Tax=Phyllobacterium sp. SYP-B3895 TaxID=2663240 RepID=UPI001299874D|nr:hypothetical protein [Phyllobacterium sp. SYP-B3895]MRG57333.1 hypothetical protein [Phyllobacterium sp. SYP-B3895]
MNLPVKNLMRLSFGAVLISGLGACANNSAQPVMANSPLTGPVNTGTYPHFTPDPKGETTQFTPEEKQALIDRTTAAKTAAQSGPSADPAAAAKKQADLQKLIKQQQDDLTAIEGKKTTP